MKAYKRILEKLKLDRKLKKIILYILKTIFVTDKLQNAYTLYNAPNVCIHLRYKPEYFLPPTCNRSEDSGPEVPSGVDGIATVTAQGDPYKEYQ